MKKKKNIHTQQSSSGQVPTYCIDVAIIIKMQKNVLFNMISLYIATIVVSQKVLLYH